MLKILVVEDEKVVRDLLRFVLDKNKYEVILAEDGIAGYNYISNNSVDLVVSDVVMPGLDGFELLKKVRENNNNVPFVMLTGIGSDEKQIEAFEHNIEDYILKPFNVEIVVAKINQIMARIYNVNSEISLCKNNKSMIIYGKTIEFTKKEFAIMSLLYENRNEWVAKEVIFKTAWKLEKEQNLRSVDFTIKRIRQKMGSHSDAIVTKRGVGYKYEI